VREVEAELAAEELNEVEGDSGGVKCLSISIVWLGREDMGH